MKLKKLLGVILACMFCACLSVGVGIIVSADTAETTSSVIENKNYVSATYKDGTHSLDATTESYYGMRYDSSMNSIVLTNSDYDATANGGWLVYKVTATEGNYITSLKVAMVGNRLGSFGLAAGVTTTAVAFKPYISRTGEFENPVETIVLPSSTECYNCDYDFTSAIADVKSNVWYIKLWFGSNNPPSGFYWDWWQLGTVTITGSEKQAITTKTYVDATYKDGTHSLDATTESYYGMRYDSSMNSIVLTNSDYDATANGGWLVYKVTATEGNYITSLKVAMVGNRLGSFGLAAGVTTTAVAFKPYISKTGEFENPVETIVLPSSTECYNCDYDFTSAIADVKSNVWYIKLWFGSNNPPSGFYWDWWQLGTVTITGSELEGEPDPIPETTYVNANYVGNANTLDATAESYYGVKYDASADAIVLTTAEEGYDATAFGGWIVYKVEAANGNYIDSLKVAMVGDRLGSFGVAAGASNHTVTFKAYISRHGGFKTPVEERVLPSSTSCYNCDYDFTDDIAGVKSNVWYIKLWFGSSDAGEGFYWDWFQLGSVTIKGTEASGEIDPIITTDASSATVTIESASYVYTGSEIAPAVQVTLGEVVLENGVDYTVAYANNTAVGTATITVNFIYDYSGSATATFEIVAIALGAEDVNVTLSQTEYEFVEGEVYEPTVTVVYGEATLALGTDYTVAYTNNTAIGTATAVVTFTGIYSGSVEVNYVINEKAPDVSSETSDVESSSTETGESSEYAESSCIASMGLGSVLAFVAFAGAAIFFKKKEN